MTAEPLGPALAAELGGVWMGDDSWIDLAGVFIHCRVDGSVWLDTEDEFVRLGSFSDGAAALARQARRLGVA